MYLWCLGHFFCQESSSPHNLYPTCKVALSAMAAPHNDVPLSRSLRFTLSQYDLYRTHSESSTGRLAFSVGGALGLDR